jgi:hypothetical protein
LVNSPHDAAAELPAPPPTVVVTVVGEPIGPTVSNPGLASRFALGTRIAANSRAPLTK